MLRNRLLKKRVADSQLSGKKAQRIDSSTLNSRLGTALLSAAQFSLPLKSTWNRRQNPRRVSNPRASRPSLGQSRPPRPARDRQDPRGTTKTREGPPRPARDRQDPRGTAKTSEGPPRPVRYPQRPRGTPNTHEGPPRPVRYPQRPRGTANTHEEPRCTSADQIQGSG